MRITKDNFKMIIESLGYVVEPEFQFAKPRKFRADWKVSKDDKIVIVEYEGIVGKSRHTSLTGYTKDCEKYNLATILGYKVLRYTVMNFDDVINDLEKTIG